MVRHGQTDWNLGNRIQGQHDVPLNNTGRAQAHAMAKKLAQFNLEYIVSSDLSRAMETAQIIGNKLNIGVDYDARLREYDFGVLTGINRAGIDPNGAAAFFTNPTKFGAEKLESAFMRVGHFLQDIDFDKNILVVTHGGVLNFVLCYLENNTGINSWDYMNKCTDNKIRNASILRIRDLNSEIAVLKNTRFYRLSKIK